MRVQHLVQTRFSVRMFWGHADGAPLDWLERRLELLHTYCAPAIAAQSSEHFTWLLYCDRGTPPEVMAPLRRLEREIPALRIAPTYKHFIGRATQPFVDPRADVLITTRVDSDDAIHASYVEATQEHADAFAIRPGATMLVNFPRGYQLDHATGQLYFGWSPNSAFHSLFECEPLGSRTVLYGSHLTMHRWHPTVQDDSLPAWLAVIHSGNVFNRLAPEAAPAPRERLRAFGLVP